MSRVPLRAAATHPRVLHCHDYAAIICIHTADTGSIYDNDFLEICKLFYAGFYRCADRAIVVEAETGKVHEITAGATADALLYEMTDMEDAILNGNTGVMRLKDTRDVMELMTGLRKEWNMKYPGEEW